MNPFLEPFYDKDTKFEFVKILDGKITIIDDTEADYNKNANIYFLGGVRKDLVYSQGIRAKDADIVKKSYLCIDLDIRSNYKKLNKEITDEEIIQLADKLKIKLEESQWTKEWTYIVYSGNGIHLYYIGDGQSFDKENYSLGVEYIYQRFDEIMGEEFKCDHSCKNIGRIMRLPGSINQKNGKRVDILYYKECKSRFIDQINIYADKIRKKKEEENKIKEQQIKETLSKFSGTDNEIYMKINKQIPAWQIAQLLLPQFTFDGKKNFLNEKRGYTGYFYNEEDNSIVNGGSRYFDWGHEGSGWDNFNLIKRSRGFSNAETFKFFKELLNIN